MEILKINPSHLTRIEEIENLCFSDPWGRKVLEHELFSSFSTMIVATDKKTNEKVFGYAGIRCIVDEADITTIGVDPKYQKRGYGKMLLAWLIDHCKKNNIKIISLEVRESNKKAISLYKSFGFNIISLKKLYYSSPKEDGYLMQKNLT